MNVAPELMTVRNFGSSAAFDLLLLSRFYFVLAIWSILESSCCRVLKPYFALAILCLLELAVSWHFSPEEPFRCAVTAAAKIFAAWPCPDLCAACSVLARF